MKQQAGRREAERADEETGPRSRGGKSREGCVQALVGVPGRATRVAVRGKPRLPLRRCCKVRRCSVWLRSLRR